MARFRLMKKGTGKKFNNKKVTTPDGVFDSQREWKRWEQLKLLVQIGAIVGLARQVKFFFQSTISDHEDTPGCYLAAGFTSSELKRKVSYTADFVYLEQGKLVVEDYKGFRTEAYKRKRQWMKRVYGITILET